MKKRQPGDAALNAGAPEYAFSVAVATYNRSDIIGETIGHILGQTFPPVEVVVVDDGSSDATEAAVAAVADDRVKYHRIENKGPGTALGTAIDLCTAPWITICDDDDRWRPFHLERRSALLKRYPEADFTFSDFTAFGPGARPGYSHFSKVPDEWWNAFPPPDKDGFQWLGSDLLPFFLRRNPVFPFTACISRDLWRRSGGVEDKFSRFGCWDAHMTWRLALHGTIACDHTITAERREHATNFSKKRSRVSLERIAMLQASIEDGLIPAQYAEVVTEQIWRSHHSAARYAWDEHDYASLRQILGKTPPRRWRSEYWKFSLCTMAPGAIIDRFRRNRSESRLIKNQ